MKIKLVLPFFILISVRAAAQTPPVAEPVTIQDPYVYKPGDTLARVDEPAQFPGGQPALNQFLAMNINYPKAAIESELEGRCYVKFVVNKNGEISNAKIMKGVPGCEECDNEVLRVVKEMPDWTPAKYQGQIVDSYYNLPVSFKLTGKKRKRKD